MENSGAFRFAASAQIMICDRAVSLVPFGQVHVERTFGWISDKALRRQFLLRGDVTWEGHVSYFNRVLADPIQRVFAIFADGCHVGNCGFKNLDLENKKGELWIYLGEPSTRGKGIGLRSTELLIDLGVSTLGLELIYLHVADFNAAARNIYRKLGFVEVPLQSEATSWADRGCEIIRMELREV